MAVVKANSRVTVREKLYRAAIGHMVKRGWAVHREFGLNGRARRGGQGHYRADLFCNTLKGKYAAIEIKSSVSDLRADKKLHNYCGYCHRLWIVTTETVWKKMKDKYPFPEGCGVLVLSMKTGLLRSVRRTKEYDLGDDVWRSIAMRLSYRTAEFSRRNTVRRRVYLTEAEEKASGT